MLFRTGAILRSPLEDVLWRKGNKYFSMDGIGDGAAWNVVKQRMWSGG